MLCGTLTIKIKVEKQWKKKNKWKGGKKRKEILKADHSQFRTQRLHEVKSDIGKNCRRLPKKSWFK